MRKKKRIEKDREQSKPLKYSLAEMLRLPQDAVCGDTLLTFIGKSRLKIENYRSILVYSDTLIRIQGKNYRVAICGKRLWIRYYDKDEMEIGGRIETVNFE